MKLITQLLYLRCRLARARLPRAACKTGCPSARGMQRSGARITASTCKEQVAS